MTGSSQGGLDCSGSAATPSGWGRVCGRVAPAGTTRPPGGERQEPPARQGRGRRFSAMPRSGPATRPAPRRSLDRDLEGLSLEDQVRVGDRTAVEMEEALPGVQPVGIRDGSQSVAGHDDVLLTGALHRRLLLLGRGLLLGCRLLLLLAFCGPVLSAFIRCLGLLALVGCLILARGGFAAVTFPCGVPGQTQLCRAGRPCTPALALQHVLGNCDLLFPGGVGRVTGAAMSFPGLGQELQASVVAVAGVDRPVTTGFALGERVPGGVGASAGGSHHCSGGEQATDCQAPQCGLSLGNAHCLFLRSPLLRLPTYVSMEGGYPPGSDRGGGYPRGLGTR